MYVFKNLITYLFFHDFYFLNYTLKKSGQKDLLGTFSSMNAHAYTHSHTHTYTHTHKHTHTLTQTFPDVLGGK